MSDWRADGRCVPYFGDWDHLDTTTKVGVCRGCPVRAQCATLGLNLLADYGPPPRDDSQVYGGMTLRQLAKASR